MSLRVAQNVKIEPGVVGGGQSPDVTALLIMAQRRYEAEMVMRRAARLVETGVSLFVDLSPLLVPFSRTFSLGTVMRFGENAAPYVGRTLTVYLKNQF